MRADLLSSAKLFVDETKAPVFGPRQRQDQDRLLLGDRP
jgi:hypothetical protein